MKDESSQPVRRAGAARPMLTVEDLAADLVWPRLLRAGTLSLHPARLVLSFLVVALIAAVFWLLFWVESSLGWTGSEEARRHLASMLHHASPMEWGAQWPHAEIGVGEIDARIRINAAPSDSFGERIVDLFFTLPMLLVRSHPLPMLLGVPIVLLLAIIASAAIIRSAATEFTGERGDSLLSSINFARERIISLIGATLGPVLAIWSIALALAVGGFLLLRLPGLNILGAILFGLSLLLGLVAMFLLFLYVAGKPLLIPAVCCDGADALDAIQRTYAYVLARPLRLALYLGILFIQGLVLFTIVSAMCAATVAFTARASGTWANDEGRRMVHGVRVEPLPDHEATTRERLYNAGARVVRAWNGIPATVPAAFLFSYFGCASAVLYLGMRRVCDGQDMNELWSPQEDRIGALGAGSAPGDTDADAE